MAQKPTREALPNSCPSQTPPVKIRCPNLKKAPFMSHGDPIPVRSYVKRPPTGMATGGVFIPFYGQHRCRRQLDGDPKRLSRARR